MKRHTYFLAVVMVFTVLGFFASLFLFLSWLIAPVYGWLSWGYSRDKTVLAIVCSGIFLGGLPMWLIFSSGMDLWPARLLFVASTPLLILAGVLVRQINFVFRRRDKIRV